LKIRESVGLLVGVLGLLVLAWQPCAADVNVTAVIDAMKENVSPAEREQVLDRYPKDEVIGVLLGAVQTRQGLPTETRHQNAWSSLVRLSGGDNNTIENSRVVSQLMKGAGHEDPVVRRICLGALGRVAPGETRKVRPLLNQALSDADPEVIAVARKSLEMLDTASDQPQTAPGTASRPPGGGSHKPNLQELLDLIQKKPAKDQKSDAPPGDGSSESGQPQPRESDEKMDLKEVGESAKLLWKKVNEKADSDPQMKQAVEDFQKDLGQMEKVLKKPKDFPKHLSKLQKSAGKLKKEIEKDPALKSEFDRLLTALQDLAKGDLKSVFKGLF
jgi:hypothetical protein